MRHVYAAGALLLTAGIVAGLVAALATPVTPSRGRAEIDFAHLGNIGLDPGEALDQPVQVQSGNLTYVDFPYRWLAASPSIVEVTITSASGRQLASQRLELAPTTLGIRAFPGLSASYWDGQQARIASIHTAAPPPGETEIVVRLRRLDGESDPVILFTEDPAAAAGKLPLAQAPRVSLVYMTRYGATEPVYSKLPLYATRLSGLNSAWPGKAVPLLAILLLPILLALMGLLAVSGGQKPGRNREQAEEGIERP